MPTETCVESGGRARVRAEETNSRAGEGKPSSSLAETKGAVGESNYEQEGWRADVTVKTTYQSEKTNCGKGWACSLSPSKRREFRSAGREGPARKLKIAFSLPQEVKGGRHDLRFPRDCHDALLGLGNSPRYGDLALQLYTNTETATWAGMTHAQRVENKGGKRVGGALQPERRGGEGRGERERRGVGPVACLPADWDTSTGFVLLLGGVGSRALILGPSASLRPSLYGLRVRRCVSLPRIGGLYLH